MTKYSEKKIIKKNNYMVDHCILINRELMKRNINTVKKSFKYMQTFFKIITVADLS